MKKKKAIKFVAIVFSIAIFLGGVFFGYRVFLSHYFDETFYGEDFIESDDGAFSYLQFNSPKNLISKIAIFSREQINPVTNSYTNVLVGFLDTSFRGGDIFRNSEMKNISWGVNTYDLFFDHTEKGVFCYQYVDGEWVGELYLDKERTKSEIAKGNNSIYYFAGERKVVNNTTGFERISGTIPVESIPKYYLDKLNTDIGIKND